MQKSFIAIALALTLTCAFAYVSPTPAGYVKVPQSVALNNDSNFTNSTNLNLLSVNIGELDLVAFNYSTNTNNASAGTFNAAWRKLDGKALTASTNTSSTFTGTNFVLFVLNNYALTLSFENDTNSIPQIVIYQSALTGGATAPRIYASSNINATWQPSIVGVGIISKTVYVFYTVSGNQDTLKVNVTNFVAGGAKGSLEFTLTTAFNNTVPGSLKVVWGESLGSSQLYANWMEGGVLKYATVDVSKGTVTANPVGTWQSTYSCVPYATDKKWFGELCTNSTGVNQSIYVRTNTTNLALLTVNNQTLYQFSSVYAYGPYIAIFYTDSTTTPGPRNTTYNYDIWNLDTFATFRNKTIFLTADITPTFYRVTSAGLYTFTYDGNGGNMSIPRFQNLQVGLVLGSSYLTSVLGFILTIVAGLFLF